MNSNTQKITSNRIDQRELHRKRESQMIAFANGNERTKVEARRISEAAGAWERAAVAVAELTAARQMGERERQRELTAEEAAGLTTGLETRKMG